MVFLIGPVPEGNGAADHQTVSLADRELSNLGSTRPSLSAADVRFQQVSSGQSLRGTEGGGNQWQDKPVDYIVAIRLRIKIIPVVRMTRMTRKAS